MLHTGEEEEEDDDDNKVNLKEIKVQGYGKDTVCREWGPWRAPCFINGDEFLNKLSVYYLFIKIFSPRKQLTVNHRAMKLCTQETKDVRNVKEVKNL
jgi:hypothetical protein